MEKFEELSQEKQRRIIDAGMEAFGRYEYKKANTEDFFLIGGISICLFLFYLYVYTIMHVIQFVNIFF